MLIHRDINACTDTHKKHTLGYLHHIYILNKAKNGYSTLHMTGNRLNHKA